MLSSCYVGKHDMLKKIHIFKYFHVIFTTYYNFVEFTIAGVQFYKPQGMNNFLELSS